MLSIEKILVTVNERNDFLQNLHMRHFYQSFQCIHEIHIDYLLLELCVIVRTYLGIGKCLQLRRTNHMEHSSLETPFVLDWLQHTTRFENPQKIKSLTARSYDI